VDQRGSPSYVGVMGRIKKTEEVNSNPGPRREYCNRCLRETNQDILYSKSIRWEEDLDDDEEVSVSGASTYSLIQCRGCDNVRMLHEHWFSEDWGDHGGPELHKEYHPPNVLRQRPEWLNLGLAMHHSEMSDLLREIYRALGVNAPRLASMGIRALVERMMIDKVTDQGSFEKNVKEFFDKGYVAGFQQGIFKDTLLEAGHAAMHREWEPSAEDVNTLLDIVEGLVKAIYVDPAKAQKVEARIPKRVRPSRPKKS
jgi:hypothetical protein